MCIKIYVLLGLISLNSIGLGQISSLFPCWLACFFVCLLACLITWPEVYTYIYIFIYREGDYCVCVYVYTHRKKCVYIYIYALTDLFGIRFGRASSLRSRGSKNLNFAKWPGLIISGFWCLEATQIDKGTPKLILQCRNCCCSTEKYSARQKSILYYRNAFCNT